MEDLNLKISIFFYRDFWQQKHKAGDFSTFFFFFFFFCGEGMSEGPFSGFLFLVFLIFYLLKLIYQFILPLQFLSMIQKETLCFIKTFPSSTDHRFCALAMYV